MSILITGVSQFQKFTKNVNTVRNGIPFLTVFLKRLSVGKKHVWFLSSSHLATAYQQLHNNTLTLKLRRQPPLQPPPPFCRLPGVPTGHTLPWALGPHTLTRHLGPL